MLGVVCPKCGCGRLLVVSTRRLRGKTVRVRRCAGCAHAVRTGERIESTAAGGKAVEVVRVGEGAGGQAVENARSVRG